LAVDVATAAIHQLRTLSSSSDRWVHLLGRCPPQVALEATRRVRQSIYSSTTLCSWVHNEEVIPSRNFQLFLDHLLHNAPLASVESLYWFHVGGAKLSTSPPAMVDIPQWLAVQCALYCVNNKLRTTLGKPQETFLTIEDAIKKAARGGTKEEVMEQNIVQLTRVQLLLSFYEYLEKFMFNAYDGSSNALPAAPKVKNL
jgi:Serine/threonine-protein kinase smg-1